NQPRKELFVISERNKGAKVRPSGAYVREGKGPAREMSKKFGPFLDLCVSSLRRGHANLLCIVPILSDVP
uniref:Uncharacterized protein n=1 Tax=Aegilops tauschii subsp. strangulata TaxID=200361 RepID=A0A453DW14_AEGTS